MDLSQAITIMEAMKFTPMSPTDIADMEQFRFADPRPTYKDISQMLAMLERFELVRREAVGDTATTNWRLQPQARGIRTVAALSEYIEGQLQTSSPTGPADTAALERKILTALAEIGGRSDLNGLRSHLQMGAGGDQDPLFQALAELQAQGLLALSYGATEVDFPWFRLTKKGWLDALQGT